MVSIAYDDFTKVHLWRNDRSRLTAKVVRSADDSWGIVTLPAVAGGYHHARPGMKTLASTRLLLAMCLAVSALPAPEPFRPSIAIPLADDLSRHDHSIDNPQSGIRTPNRERLLARRGAAPATLEPGFPSPPPARGSGMVFPERDWAEATPESQGMDGSKLREAVAWLDAQSQPDGAKALVLVRNGRLIWKGSEANAYRKVFSCTKVFTSTVLGLLADDGTCQLDDRASQKWPALVSQHAAYGTITLRHLASMSGGYLGMVHDVSHEQPWGDPIAYLVPQPPRYEAGTACAYHDHDVFLLGSILTRLAQQSLQDVFRRRIAAPIGMNRWSWGVVGVLENGVAMNNPELPDPLVMLDGRWRPDVGPAGCLPPQGQREPVRRSGDEGPGYHSSQRTQNRLKSCRTLHS